MALSLEGFYLQQADMREIGGKSYRKTSNKVLQYVFIKPKIFLKTGI